MKIHNGDNLFKVVDNSQPLIEEVLWEDDVVMLLGSEKSGKSILAQQMAFALTSGQPFLEKYKVPKPVPILYLQTEGKEAELASRMRCMNEILGLNKDLFYWIYKKFFPLDHKEFKDILIEKIEGFEHKPKVIFVDSLYTSCTADFNNNKECRTLFGALSVIQEIYKTAIVLIHHDKKAQIDDDGDRVHKGDKDMYGSTYLRAFVEHILYLNNPAKTTRAKTRYLTCDTTRTGKVMPKEKLFLIEPKPLCFDIDDQDFLGIAKVIEHFFRSKGQPYTVEHMAQDLKLPKDWILRTFWRMMSINRIEKIDEERYRWRG